MLSKALQRPICVLGQRCKGDRTRRTYTDTDTDTVGHCPQRRRLIGPNQAQLVAMLAKGQLCLVAAAVVIACKQSRLVVLIIKAMCLGDLNSNGPLGTVLLS